VSYNSCRNRNCPKCQGLARAQWLADRQAELLEVPYFHVVLTLPEPIAVIAFQNQTVVYDILFRAASCTIWRRRLSQANCGSSPSTVICTSPQRSAATWYQPVMPSGWSVPTGLLPVPLRRSTMSADTHTASPSPTTG